MKIIRIQGGLGNQIFQYSFALYLKEKTNENIYLDLRNYKKKSKRKYMLDKIFDVNLKKINYLLSTIYLISEKIKEIITNKSKILYESKSHNVTEKDFSDYTYFIGYWQDEKYKMNLIKNTKRNIIANHNKVAVHIRKSDYLDYPNNLTYFDISFENYYEKAFKYFINRNHLIEFDIFTDDYNWVKKNIKSKYKLNIVDKGNLDSLTSFNLMRRYENFIIANSTFSFWAATLSFDNAIKISPKRWFHDNNKQKKIQTLLKNFVRV